uniref:Ribosomal protein S16 n=1 Tax=Pleurostichidium falkenbergii TaxID=121064 RepID=A0A4D6UZ11_9FLOR|nr:ribosomal protein S16 [Pleurostichidium falkenbergii]QCH39754.1 ribosomal protein S16 [Pleurostichidium falkenbergii]
MLKIRLKRLGRKKRPFYRIIVIDSRKKRDGKAIKELGFYNPLTKQDQLDMEKVDKKIKEGAQVTKAVQRIISKNYR